MAVASDVELVLSLQIADANKKLDLLTSKFEGLGKKGKKGADAANASLLRMAKTAGTAVVAYASLATAQKAYNLAATSARASDTVAIFEKTSGSIQRLRDMTQGLVSDAVLAKNANLARTMGLTTDEFGKITQLAIAASKATGESVEFQMESLTKGFARESRLLLDNAGILIDRQAVQKETIRLQKENNDLTEDAAKKQAFINIGLQAGQPLLDEAAAAGATAADNFNRASTSVDNFTQALGESLQPMMSAVAAELVTLSNELVRIMRGSEALETGRMSKATELANKRRGLLDAANFAAGTEGLKAPALFDILAKGTGEGGIRKSLIPGADNAAIDAKNVDRLADSLIKLSAVMGDSDLFFNGPKAKKKTPLGGNRKPFLGGNRKPLSYDKWLASQYGGAGDSKNFLGGQSSSSGADPFLDAQLRSEELAAQDADWKAGPKGMRDKDGGEFFGADAFEAAEDAKIAAFEKEVERNQWILDAKMDSDARVAEHEKMLKDKQHAENLERIAMIENAAAKGIGISVDLAQAATEMYMDGEKHAIELLAAMALKKIGTEFVGTGSLFAAKGIGMAIEFPLDPRGYALSALGAGMIGTGIGMGAASIAINKSVAGGGDAVSGRAIENRGNGTQNVGSSGQTVINVNYGVMGPHPDDTARAIVGSLAHAQRRNFTSQVTR